MPSNVMTHRALESAEITAVGIDVGGEQKGFHAVALIGGNYACRLATKDVPELARWCRKTIRPLVIAIDAPWRWSDDGRARPAERALMKQGISCFSTPTRSREFEASHQLLRLDAAGSRVISCDRRGVSTVSHCVRGKPQVLF